MIWHTLRVSLTILGVHHVAIQVDDLDAARRFYGEVMGLPEIIDRPDFDVAGAWFQLGAHELHLGVEDGHTASERQHFAIEVSDLDVAVAAIESHGVRCASSGPRSPEPEIRRSCVTPQGTSSSSTNLSNPEQAEETARLVIPSQSTVLNRTR